MRPKKMERTKQVLNSKSNSVITCKLTGTIDKGVKAHIIPRAFYEIPAQDKDLHNYKLISNVKGVSPKKMPIGIYDRTIVTVEGETLFNHLDNYATTLLIDKRNDFLVSNLDNDKFGLQLVEYDYSKLKLFALSVLWRAHSSSQKPFEKVNLGNHEKIIRQMILSNQPEDSECYSVVISSWEEVEFGPVFMCPYPEKFDGVNYYRIYCGRYSLHIKVDRRESGRHFQGLQLSPNYPLYIVVRSLKCSNEWSVMRDLVHLNYN